MPDLGGIGTAAHLPRTGGRPQTPPSTMADRRRSNRRTTQPSQTGVVITDMRAYRAEGNHVSTPFRRRALWERFSRPFQQAAAVLKAKVDAIAALTAILGDHGAGAGGEAHEDRVKELIETLSRLAGTSSRSAAPSSADVWSKGPGTLPSNRKREGIGRINEATAARRSCLRGRMAARPRGAAAGPRRRHRGQGQQRQDGTDVCGGVQ